MAGGREERVRGAAPGVAGAAVGGLTSSLGLSSPAVGPDGSDGFGAGLISAGAAAAAETGTLVEGNENAGLASGGAVAIEAGAAGAAGGAKVEAGTVAPVTPAAGCAAKETPPSFGAVVLAEGAAGAVNRGLAAAGAVEAAGGADEGGAPNENVVEAVDVPVAPEVGAAGAAAGKAVV